MNRKHSFTFSCQARVEASLQGDRLKLPPSILERLLSADQNSSHQDSLYNSPSGNIPQLLIFELQWGDKKAYGSPKEFTSDPDTITMSADLAQALGLHESPGGQDMTKTESLDSTYSESEDRMDVETLAGPRVQLRFVELPTGTAVHFSPLTTDFLEIEDMRSLLESHLRKHHTTLFQGQILKVPYLHHRTGAHKTLQMLITKLEPSEACLCVNTDLEVIMQPLDENLAWKAIQTAKQGSQSHAANGIKKTSLDWSMSQSKEGQQWEASYKDIIENEECHVFSIPYLQDAVSYEIQVVPNDFISGDIDLYASWIEETPGLFAHDYYSLEQGKSLVTVPRPENIDSLPQKLYISMNGLAPKTEYELRVLAASFSPQPSASHNDQVEHGSDEIQCSNCRAWIPSRTHLMHSAFCARNNAYCDICKTVMKKTEFETHWHCPQPECGKVH